MSRSPVIVAIGAVVAALVAAFFACFGLVAPAQAAPTPTAKILIHAGAMFVSSDVTGASIERGPATVDDNTASQAAVTDWSDSASARPRATMAGGYTSSDPQAQVAHVESGRGSIKAVAGAVGSNLCALPAAMVAANAAPKGKPFAMGISDHLDDFAGRHGADTWKNLDDPVDWKPGVLQKLRDPDQRVLFNLDGVDVWPGVTRAASGRGGATDWELLQMRSGGFPNLEFWRGGTRVGSPFE